MPLPQRYVLREAGTGFVVTACLLTGLLVLGGGTSLARQAEGVGASLLLRLLPDLIWSSAFLALPIALLLASTFTFSRLAAEGELDAFRASGIPARRLLPPVVVLGLAVTAVLVVVVGNVAPRAQHRLRRAVKEALREVLMNLGPGPRTITVEETTIAWSDFRDGRVDDLRLMVAPKGHLQIAFQARQARMRFDPATDDLVFDVDRADLVQLDAEHGRRGGDGPIDHIKNTAAGAAGRRLGREYRISFQAYERLVVPVGEKFDRRLRLENLTLDELDGLAIAWSDSAATGLPPKRNEGHVRSWLMSAHYTERWKRRLLPWAAVFIVIIGAAMGCAARRKSKLQAFVYGLVPVLLVYYLPLQLCETLGREGQWPPWFAITLPHALLGALAFGLAWWRCRQ